MNRVGMGLALGAGYLLGRTKKMKLAFAVGTMVAGKRMHLSPKALADLMSQQLQNNPQFKEIGDQLRQDLRGVGKAASGAMVERQINSLADRLHSRTAQVHDQLSGVAGTAAGRDSGEEDDGAGREDTEEEEPREEYDEDEPGNEEEAPDAEAEDESPDEEEDEAEPAKRTAKKAAKKTAAPKSAAKKAPAKKTAAKKTASKKAPAKKTAKKTAGRGGSAARGAARGARTRLPKGDGER
ncbi:DNA primase [Streptomyces griseorubiginosus]|uniref:DNA primase n=1 Tax=Streptomyces griseorubiginosus TaxID=67304 RepID=UPI001AD6AC38|nr:DNA primase [Streptomyces griseorubiginosus]MBO4255537.1 DNA primase [Streptomyces griseorubiginosus]